MDTRMEYLNKDVYVGIDVHKRTYSLCIICDGLRVKRFVMAADPKQLINSLEKHFRGAKIHSAYEAGFSGFALHRFLVKSGINNIVVNPASIETAARDKVKTDKRDSLKLATQLFDGRLKGILVPTEEQELRRLLTRTREQLVSEKTRLSSQIKARLYQFGLITFDDKAVVSEVFLSRYLKPELPYELKTSLETLVQLWRAVCLEIKRYRGLLAQQGRNDERVHRIYESVPGIGPIGARILSNELGDMEQFKSEKKLFGFIGFTPSEYSTGDSRRQGHISRQGSGRLRWVLTEAAWVAIKTDPALKTAYERIKVKAGGKKAIVAIARKLIGRIRSCFKQNTLYQLGVGIA